MRRILLLISCLSLITVLTLSGSAITSATTNSETISINIANVNRAPVAVPDPNIQTNENAAVVISVLANDYDPDTGDIIYFNSIVTPPAHGTTSPNPNGTVTYTPSLNFSGSDSFTYNIVDNASPHLTSNTARVDIMVNTILTKPVKLYNASNALIASFDNIQPAINAAQNNYRITADPGTYTEIINYSAKSLIIESTGTAANSFISGNLTGTVVTFPATTSNASLRRFTILNGRATGNGGGILINQANNIKVEDCIVDGSGIASTLSGNLANPVKILNTIVYNNNLYESQGYIFVEINKYLRLLRR